jgi:hypothetical protein
MAVSHFPKSTSLTYALILTNKSAIDLRIWKERPFENTLKSDRDLWWHQWIPIWVRTPIWVYHINMIYIYYPIQYIKNCWVRLLSNFNIKYICTIYTRLYTCLTSNPRFALREKVTLRLLKLPFREWMWLSGLGCWT